MAGGILKVLLKTFGFVTKNVAGNVPEVSLKVSSGARFPKV